MTIITKIFINYCYSPRLCGIYLQNSATFESFTVILKIYEITTVRGSNIIHSSAWPALAIKCDICLDYYSVALDKYYGIFKSVNP